MQWGWNPDSLIAWSTFGAGIATVVAMVAAGIAGWAALASLGSSNRAASASVEQTELLSAQLRCDQERRSRSHAEAISVWTWLDPEKVEGRDSEGLLLQLHNASRATIYDLRIAIVLGTETEAKPRYAAQRRSLHPTHVSQPVVVELTPGAIDAWKAWLKQGRRGKNIEPNVEFSFRDAAGARWVRTLQGDLERHLKKCDRLRPWIPGSASEAGCDCDLATSLVA